MRILDLFSGLGGASEYFFRMGWEVHRLDNNVLLNQIPRTEMIDVREWPFRDIPTGYYDVIWASPPCLEFSQAYSAPAMIAKREGREFEPSLELLKLTMEIIEHLEPKYWIIENVRGARTIFSKELGLKTRQIVNQFYFWGNFPYVHIDSDWRHSKYDGDKWSSDPLRANYRAKIPLELSKAFYLAITSQRQLTEWI